MTSLVKNSGLENEEDKYWLSTYASTIKEGFWYAVDNIRVCDAPKYEIEENKYVSKWIIRIYETEGNRGSRLSVTQNKTLGDIVCR